MNDEIVNRVAQSGIETIDLEDFYPRDEVAALDLQQFLFRGMILREKDFREAVKAFDWASYKGKRVAIFCSAEAIIPRWAYMLVATSLQPFAAEIFAGTQEAFAEKILTDNLQKEIDPQAFAGKRVVIKGCGDREVPESAYTTITVMLLPYVKSLMYGEACSSVPVYKKNKS